MTYETSQADFVALMFIASPNFDQHATLHEALEDRSLHPDLRFDHIWSRINDRTWKEIEISYDPAAWNRDLIFEEI